MSVLTDMTVREVAYYAYAKYREAQDRVGRIEERALARFRDAEIARYQMRTASEYWKYRELCGTRNYWENELRNAAAIATMESSG